jgi:hypothetical protein
MEPKRWVSLTIRIVIALVLGVVLLKFVFSGTSAGQQMSPMDRLFGMFVAIFYGLALFALFGWSLLESIVSGLGIPSTCRETKTSKLCPNTAWRRPGPD